jgi:O-antigen ligase
VTLATLLGLFAVLVAGEAKGVSSPTLPVLVAGLGLVVTVGTGLLKWRNLVLLLLLVILFVPIRKYSLSGSAGFELEPYRAVAGIILALWVAALMTDHRVRFRAIKFEPQILTIVFVTLASIVANTGRIYALGVQTIVLKGIVFFLALILIVYFLASVIRTREDLDFVVKVLVVGGAILSFFALLEFNTGYNVFDHMNRFFPLLRLENTGFHDLEVRGGKARVYGSSQHPIAYGAMLTMLVPLAIYLARRTRTRFWWSAAGLLVLGSLATISRTGIVMIIVILIMYARTFPKFVRRLWPLLVPAILVIHFALPGSLGTLWGSFFPKGGIVSQQEAGAGTRGSGRLADLGPGLAEAMQTPLLGQGYSTRVVDETSPLQNAPILDDQWLGTLLETGILGMAAWLWLFVGFTRRMMRRAREDVDSPDAWLYAALGSAVASFAWGMAFYDAFAFIQVTFVALLLITLGGLLLTQEPLRARAPAPAPAR